MYEITTFRKGGAGNGTTQGSYRAEELENVVGKEVAEKIINGEGDKFTTGKDNRLTSTELSGLNIKVGGKGMKGFYGSPTEGSLGIVGNVAKSLFKQEPKTTKIETKDKFSGSEKDISNGTPLSKQEAKDFYYSKKGVNDGLIYAVKENGKAVELNTLADINETSPYDRIVKVIPEKATEQHSIDITPELKASVEGGQPLFKDAQAQYRIENGKNIVEAIKDFNGSPRATVALTHEIMHPTVVAIIDGAKEGNQVGVRHTQTIVDEYNKANPKNKVTVEQLIEGNEAFKSGTTSKQYRAVQEFIAKSWEKYHKEGGKGFSAEFQKVLDQITEAFKAVYKSISGKELTPELRKMFDEILGKESVLFKEQIPTIENKNLSLQKWKQKTRQWN